MNATVDGFQTADYVVFVLVVVASFLIGVYHAVASQSKTTEKYLMADRKLRIIPTAISILMSYISAISILGHSAETYFYGVTYYFNFIGFIGGGILAAVIFVPLFYPLQLTSIDEYLYLRYRSRLVVYVGLMLQIISYIFVSGVVLYGPATMLQSMAGWPEWSTMLGLGLLSTVYTTIGGFKAVIWSDVFQGVVMFGGLLAILIIGVVEVGGITEVWKTYSEYDRLEINIDPSPFERSTVWAFSIGTSLTLCALFGTTQVAMQRYCALPSLKAAKTSMLATIPANFFIQICTFTSGVIAFAYFAKTGCDPLIGGFIINANQVIPYYVLHVLNYPMVPGIFVAAVFCASLSNLSSFYNSIAALMYEDIFKAKLVMRHEETKTIVTKIVAFAAGIISLAVGFVVSTIGGTLVKVVVTLNSITAAPFVVLVVCGALSRRLSYKCALIGAMAACACTTWVAIGNQFSNVSEPTKPLATRNCVVGDSELNAAPLSNYTTPEVFSTETVTEIQETVEGKEPLLLYKMSFMWYLPFGVIAGIIVSFLASLLPYFAESNPNDIDPELLFSRSFRSKTYAVSRTTMSDSKGNENTFHMKTIDNQKTKVKNGSLNHEASDFKY